MSIVLVLPGVKEAEWADGDSYIAGVKVAKIAGFRYGVEVDQAHLHAGGDDPHSIQSGNRKPAGMIKLFKSAVDTMNAAAIEAGGRDLTDLEFDAQFVYKEKGTRGLRRANVRGIRVGKFEYGWDQGAKDMAIELPYLCLGIDYL